MQHKYYEKDGELITIKEYNRLARQARRKGYSVTKYLQMKGWEKIWGNGRGCGRRGDLVVH